MQKLPGFGISFFIFAVLFISLTSIVSAIRINEFEPNPSGADSGNEWIEIYSKNEADISEYSIQNNDGDIIDLSDLFGESHKFSRYLIIELKSQWLDNSDERIYLLKSGEEIDKTDVLDDSANNGKTFQYCSGNWIFESETKDKENNCEGKDEENAGDSGKKNEGKERYIIKQKKENKTQEAEEELKIIKLNSETAKPKTYKSKIQYIKEYGMYAFAVFCIVIIIILMINRRRMIRSMEND